MSYSWLKLDVGILDDEKIRIIRKHPDGNGLFVLWVGLLCLAMKAPEPGYLEVSDGIPYTIDDLAMLFELEYKTVQLGLTLFEKYRMIQICEGGLIEIINFRKHQALDKLDHQRELARERVRRFRDKTRCNALLTRNSVTCNSPKTRDIDIDIDKEGTTLGGEYEGGPKAPPSPRFTPPTLTEVADYCKQRANNVNPATFVDHYTAKGWMIGKNKMKDWRAAVRTWERRDNGAGRPPAPSKTSGNLALLAKICRESGGLSSF